MSTKTIAVDTRVYARLSAVKREGESFSKLIDRILTQVGDAHTGGEILRGLTTVEPLSDADAEIFGRIVAENRAGESWDDRDLR